MQCFVIIPFDVSFNDVYAMINSTTKQAVPGEFIDCRRLDEIKRPGRISDDLIHEIISATFCIADLSGNNPNVMWEVGYAMALGKPIVFLSQDVTKLPFDIRDMRTIQYDRQLLASTLQQQLISTIRDTLGTCQVPRHESPLRTKPKKIQTIAVTGSMIANPERCRSRVPVILGPYLTNKSLWYCGSVGTVDEVVLEFLIEHKQDVAVVGYHSYDISERVRFLVNNNDIPFVDANKENLPRNLKAPTERDLFFLTKSDLQILLWSGRSSGTRELIEWYKENGKDYLVSFL